MIYLISKTFDRYTFGRESRVASSDVDGRRRQMILVIQCLLYQASEKLVVLGSCSVAFIAHSSRYDSSLISRYSRVDLRPQFQFFNLQQPSRYSLLGFYDYFMTWLESAIVHDGGIFHAKQSASAHGVIKQTQIVKVSIFVRGETLFNPFFLKVLVPRPDGKTVSWKLIFTPNRVRDRPHIRFHRLERRVRVAFLWTG